MEVLFFSDSDVRLTRELGVRPHAFTFRLDNLVDHGVHLFRDDDDDDLLLYDDDDDDDDDNDE